MFDTIRKAVIQNREDDALLYEYVLTEIESNVILKGLWAKAMALSEGNDNKIQPLYMQYRVQSIKDEFTKLRIAYKELSRDPLFKKLASIYSTQNTDIPAQTIENKPQEKINTQSGITVTKLAKASAAFVDGFVDGMSQPNVKVEPEQEPKSNDEIRRKLTQLELQAFKTGNYTEVDKFKMKYKLE